jgi:opacity protein-like surface antigen
MPIARLRSIGLQALCLGLLALPGARAEEPGLPPLVPALQSGSGTVWTSGIGSGFRKGVRSAGIAAGAGPGLTIVGSEQSHDIALGIGELGWVATDVLGGEHWYRGNLELWGEVFGGAQFHPDTRYVTGLTVGPRWHFMTRTAWVPFVELGAGVAATDIGEPDLGSVANFNLQGGAGVSYFLRERLALNLRVRWLHLSNADIEQPNSGSNTLLFLGGLSWFFD